VSRPVKSRHGRAFAVAAAMLAGLVASACGVPIGAAPTPLSKSELPAILTQSPTTTTTTPANSHGKVVYIYFLENRQLESEPAEVAPPVTLAELLKALDNGPTLKQIGVGITTALQTTSDLKAMGVTTRGVAEVQLDQDFFELQESEAILELGQIVFTATYNLPNVKSVQFFQPNGLPYIAANGGGSSVSGPVGTRDYCNLLPSVASTKCAAPPKSNHPGTSEAPAKGT
jgi:spore germination protein GerM